MDLPYEQYFDAMPCYVTVQDRDFKVMAANRRFREAFGDYRGRYCYQVYKHRAEKCEVCPVEQTFRDGQVHSGEERVTCLNRTEVSVIVYTEPIRNEEGHITGVMEMSTDITDVKRLQNQLRNSQAHYSRLFEEVPCYISIQDRDLNMVDANRLHRETFGDFLGCKCYEIYKHRTEECFPCTVRETFDDGQLHVHEEVVTSRDGRPINVLVHTTPIVGADGKVDRIMEMSADITQIRRLQSQLASIGLLIGSISHGIKGLLNGLNGGVYLVNKGLAAGDQARVAKGWGIVERNIERVRNMVLDILYYAKDREPDWKPVSAEAVVNEVFEAMRDKATELGIEFTRVVAPETGTFEADEKAVRAMLVNLTENAFDACRLDVKKPVHRVTLRTGQTDRSTGFEIEDNGIGMEQETREKAFSLFFSSKGSEGTGLGLFVANKIATAHGGSIQIESTPGTGTRFVVAIPNSRSGSAAEPGAVTALGTH
ncbi:MAG: PAS domain-containing protein [Acidobacteria bacterium]|nr:PAS domain-containing protein [Acidobacteriota bacterium]